ncbi:hypothetical protein NG895_23125 [Aeoliella sp. ICT_H6.2]|uniref:Uncharacterized protein n=1 Tax=Aeoliella straminimaris TaxID=2954799 RepID=A0A9X2FJ76_9BACT|nr:hypothetical protein [Aeoliella straminimaris]MCO6046801.1 hypothetical protein [Aeoliella straminimaris]
MPRFSLKVLLGVITVVAAVAAFCYVRSQPQVVAERLQHAIKQGDHEAAMRMLEESNLFEKRKLGPGERLDLKNFSHENPSIADWLQGKREGLLQADIYFSSEYVSSYTPIECKAEITSSGVRILQVEEFEPAVAILVDPDEFDADD